MADDNSQTNRNDPGDDTIGFGLIPAGGDAFGWIDVSGLRGVNLDGRQGKWSMGAEAARGLR